MVRANPNPNANPIQVHGASYDVREVVRAVLQRNASSVIALKLDVEGDEFWMLDLLSREPQLLVRVRVGAVVYGHD